MKNVKEKYKNDPHGKRGEKGLLELKAFTEDYGYATASDWQHNFQSYAIIKVASDEILREEEECKNTEKEMLVNSIVVDSVTEPLKTLNIWFSYDNELKGRIEDFVPGINVTDNLKDAVQAEIDLLKGVISGTLGEVVVGIEMMLEALVADSFVGFEGVYESYAELCSLYTARHAPTNIFSDENAYDCWTYTYAFNRDENYCTGANAVKFVVPFSFEKEGNPDVGIHIDTIFEGDIPTLGVPVPGIQVHRIGKEYPLDVKVGGNELY